MRYYAIQITDASGNAKVNFTSHPNGVMSPPDPGALQVEMDFFTADFANPAGQSSGSFVRVWGISLQQISQAFDLNNKDIAVYGGMGKGLPLANPAQSGLLIKGLVQQAFGNWIGTTMTLDLIIVAGSSTGGAASALNYAFQWKAGSQLGDMIKRVLNQVFPSYTVKLNISQNLVLPNDETGYYATLQQFSTWVQNISQKIVLANSNLGPWATQGDIDPQSYPGVKIVLLGTTFNVYDGTVAAAGSAKEIVFNDLIGQITWIEPGIVQATCVMRADIQTGASVKLPPGQITITPAAMSAYAKIRQGSVFQGTALVNRVRHVGNYKEPSAQGWVTVLDLAPQVN